MQTANESSENGFSKLQLVQQWFLGMAARILAVEVN